MKRWVAILFIPVVLTLILSGCCCPKKEAADMPTTTVAPPPQAPPETPPAPKKVAPALDSIYFAFDKHCLRTEAKAKLDKIAAWLSQNPAVKIRIEGNCDERGTNEYNLALGERRANSAKAYLVNLGISADRLAIVSYGEERPLDPGHNESAWAKNRRDDFKIVK